MALEPPTSLFFPFDFKVHFLRYLLGLSAMEFISQNSGLK